MGQGGAMRRAWGGWLLGCARDERESASRKNKTGMDFNRHKGELLGMRAVSGVKWVKKIAGGIFDLPRMAGVEWGGDM